MAAAEPMRPYHRNAFTSTRRLSRRSFGSRGGWSMTVPSGGSVPKPSAGSMSVPRSMVRICMVVSGSGTAPPESR